MDADELVGHKTRGGGIRVPEEPPALRNVLTTHFCLRYDGCHGEIKEFIERALQAV